MEPIRKKSLKRPRSYLMNQSAVESSVGMRSFQPRGSCTELSSCAALSEILCTVYPSNHKSTVGYCTDVDIMNDP